jgi:hypothetical protein
MGSTIFSGTKIASLLFLIDSSYQQLSPLVRRNVVEKGWLYVQ